MTLMNPCSGCPHVVFGGHAAPSRLSMPGQSNRLEEWRNFSAQVENHIENYTVPQYGDLPDDPLSAFTEADILTQMGRYLSRAQTNARGFEESQRDLLKIVHYAGVLYTKRAAK